MNTLKAPWVSKGLLRKVGFEEFEIMWGNGYICKGIGKPGCGSRLVEGKSERVLVGRELEVEL